MPYKMEIFQQAPRPRAYRPDIDGLRAIAIISVVLYHAGAPWISGGFSGVDVFFVISGYLIGGHIFADLLADRFSFLHFYRLRAKRILPAYFVVLACTIAVALLILSPHEAVTFAMSAFTATLSASNLYFWKHSAYFDSQSMFNPMLMTWSLGVEEQFYAIVPVIMVLLARIRRNLLLPAIGVIFVLSFLLSWRALGDQPLFVFYWLPARAWELGAGVALAVFELTRKRPVLSGPAAQIAGFAGIIMLAAPFVLLNTDTSFPGPSALSTVLGTTLIIAAGPSGLINQRVLSLSPLVFIGRISYSWYLWHWPILAFLRSLSGGSLPPAIAAGGVGLSLGLAFLSYRFVEQPFRKSTRAPVPLLLRYALTTLFFLAVCAGIWRSGGLPQRYPDLIEFENKKQAFADDPCLTLAGNERLNFLAPCYTPPDNHSVVALWGDSHAGALAPVLRTMATASGYEFDQLTRSGCRPWGNATPSGDFSSTDDRCIQFNRQVVERLAADHRVRIVIVADAWGHMFFSRTGTGNQHADEARNLYTDEAQAKKLAFLQSSIRSLEASGKRIIVMDDVPTFDTDPLVQVWIRRIPLRHAIAARLGLLEERDSELPSHKNAFADAQASRLLRSTIASLSGVALVSLRERFCQQDGRCSFRKDGHLLYLDYQHISPDGARLALKDFQIPLTE